jgi:hypothetical protein
VQRVADVVLVKDDLVAAEPATAGEVGEGSEPIVVHVGEERAASQAVDRQGVICHRVRLPFPSLSFRDHGSDQTVAPPRAIRQGDEAGVGQATHPRERARLITYLEVDSAGVAVRIARSGPPMDHSRQHRSPCQR